MIQPTQAPSFRGRPRSRGHSLSIARRHGFRAAATASVIIAAICVVSTTGAALPLRRDPVKVEPQALAANIANGLETYQINGRKFGVSTAVHVLAFSAAQYAVQVGLAHHAIDGGEQTPSTMCRTTPGCVAAVNGDFFDLLPTGQPDPGDEVGAIIQNCVLLHTPEVAHQQVDLDAQTVSEGLNWSSTVNVNGLNVPITAINQELPMSYANVHLPLSGTLLFTSPYALPTPSASGWVTYEFTQVSGATSPTTINTTTSLEFSGETTTPVRVTAGTVDISAPSGSALAALLVGNTVTLTTTSTAGCDNIGGHPILLDHGVVAPIDPADIYMVRPYARTVIGWTASGETVIMTVDGKDGVSGATAHQLVALLQSISVVTALDLDGGNSTTLFVNGRTLNHPSHKSERPVSTSLLVVTNP